jgi:hypothetical protein
MPILKVWVGHSGCNICPKNLKFSVNMWFSTSFKTPNFYEIPISSLGFMSQKQNYFKVRAAHVAKNFLFLTFLDWIFFHKFLTKFLIISST